MFRKTLVLFLVTGMVFPPVSTLAGPTVPGLRGGVPAAVPLPADTLPIPTDVNLRGVSSFTVDGAARKLTIQQDEPRAVINWKSFDIGEQAWTHFDQKGNKDWAALNRIHDLNPSRIMGRLTADGRIYLINQNGILFGPNSKVNVQSLTAATLNSVDDDFLAGLNRFKHQDYMGAGADAVSSPSVVNEGSIKVDQLGSVFLLGQSVTNSGSVDAPVGQIGLAAGSEVELLMDTSGNRAARMVKVTGEAGEAVNDKTGSLASDTGFVGMYGREIRQDSVIRAASAIKKSGRIELFATDLISTGPGSVTETPVSDSDETAHESFVYQAGGIRFSGLDQLSPGFPQVGVKRIEHRGAVAAPSGEISLEAVERVYLEAGSLIDVSGLWVDKPASARIVEAQLNSVNLKDDHGQKHGLLKGKTVQLEMHSGTAVGDIEGTLKSRELSALDRSTSGGSVFITSSDGDMVMKPGAAVSFTGGGTRYGAGALDTTTLISGRKFYDIASAPQWLVYDGILNTQSVIHKRFGIKEDYSGLFTGGAVPLHKRVDALVQGADAGMLQVMARHVLLDGILDGSVTGGPFQALAAEPTDEYGYQRALGWKEPMGGTLVIGEPPTKASAELIDFMTHAVRLSSAPTAMSRNLGSVDQPYNSVDPRESVLSAAILNGAGLGQISIYANTTYVMEEDAKLALLPGGNFSAMARSIEHNGAIVIPSGTVSLAARDNLTALASILGEPNERYVAMDSLVTIAPQSVLDVSGRILDASAAGGGIKESMAFAHLKGGSISLADSTRSGRGLFMARGALVDVSGGYGISESGKLSSGNAGGLELMGSYIGVDATLRGFSVLGSQGGTFSAHADEVRVSAGAPAAARDSGGEASAFLGTGGGFHLVQNLLDRTGFSQIELKSVNDLVIDAGATLKPSTVKFEEPLPAAVLPGLHMSGSGKGAGAQSPGSGLRQIDTPLDLLGKSSLKASAGVLRFIPGIDQLANDNARASVGEGAMLTVSPGSRISLDAPSVDVAGRLLAPSGKISLRASRHDLEVRTGSVLSATGYNKPDARPLNHQAPLGFTPLAAGEISLQAAAGSLILQQGSLLDVSGSEPVPVVFKSASGLPSVSVFGSDPGAISLTFLEELVTDGTVTGHGRSPGLRGGALTVSGRDTLNPLIVDGSLLARYGADGFDALTFSSRHGLRFSGSVDAHVARSLTLDAPRILGDGRETVNLSSPWIRLANTYWPNAAGGSPGQAQLSLSGDWLDVEGGVVLSGFESAALTAAGDIRLSDRLYNLEGLGSFWSGSLGASGGLTLTAGSIYPTTHSQFRVEAAGWIETRGTVGDLTMPIYSAGGSLTLAAPLIDHQGILAAPMGTVSLLGTGSNSRIFLGESGLISTTGTAMVNTGSLDNFFWTIPDKKTLRVGEVEGAPEKAISMQAAEIIALEGSRIDASGGGEVFSYQFQPGIDGSTNPLRKAGRFVILPDDPMAIPGDVVYLSGSDLLKEGAYTLLPEEFAFLPGAVVVTDLGLNAARGGSAYTEEGYRLVMGRTAIPGTSGDSGAVKAFSVRRAEDVLKEGNFTLAGFKAGDAGRLSLQASTTIFAGGFRAKALDGFEGGSVALSARNIYVQDLGVTLPPDFDSRTPVPVELRGNLFVSGSSLSGGGLGRIVLGDSATETVTLTPGSSLDAAIVNLHASREILVQSGARVQALSGKGAGEVGLHSPWGSINLEAGSLIHASHGITLEMSTMSFLGDLLVDNSSLNLKGERITFLPQGSSGGGAGLFVTERLWSRFGSFENVSLKSMTDIVFAGDFDLSVSGLLTLDSRRIAGDDSSGDGVADVTLRAGRIDVLNTSGDASTQSSLPDQGKLRLHAGEMVLARGDVLLDGFGSAIFDVRGDLTLKGKGSLTASGDLDILAARITGSFYSDASTPFTAADYRMLAPTGVFSLERSGGAAGAALTPGGKLSVTARSIEHGGVLDLRSGMVALAATGIGETDGVTLRGGSLIMAAGSDLGPGGSVSLTAVGGGVRLEEEARIDVSAGSRGDAGSLSIVSPHASVTLDGTILGFGKSGIGGSFTLDTLSLGEFSAINAALSAGGFNRSIDLRARTGDVIMGAGDALAAHHVSLAADAGSIDVLGRIDASGAAGGGTIALVAGGDVTLHAGSLLRTSGIGAWANGGEVKLSSAAGFVNLLPGSVVDVGEGGGGRGGLLHLRAQRQESDVRMNLEGKVSGASGILAEAFGIHAYTGAKTLGAADFEALQADTALYMANASAVESRLLSALERDGWEADALQLLPGLELRATGNMTLGTAWDLTTWRFDGKPGVLTLRSAGHLSLQADLIDHPTPVGSLLGSTASPSWYFNLTAGADLSGADVATIGNGAWDLTIQAGRQVYTESGAVRLASARDIVIGPGAATGYMINSSIRGSVGSYTGMVSGRVGRDLKISGGAIQTAVGDIDLHVGRDLVLENVRDFGSNTDLFRSLGSIRTLGEYPAGAEGLSAYWEYDQGGDIVLLVKDSVKGNVNRTTDQNRNAWDFAYGARPPREWSASYEGSDATEGIATLGGGNIEMLVGGDFVTQAGTFGKGDFSLFAGGSVDGRFLVKDGEAEIRAMGNIGRGPMGVVLEAFDARITAAALGHADIAAIVNPTIARAPFTGTEWELGYTADSSVGIRAALGDVTLRGDSPYYDISSSFARLEKVLPPTLEIIAGRDILIRSELALAPSPVGNLDLVAGRDIDGFYTRAGGAEARALIAMSDLDPSRVYGYRRGFAVSNLFNRYLHASWPLHGGDPTPSRIQADGEIRNLQLYLPEAAEITAGGDIRDIYLFGQNVLPTDITSVFAGGSLLFSSAAAGSLDTGIEVAGPGALLIQACDSIDLGTTRGIQSVGSTYNAILGDKGSDVLVAAGFRNVLGIDAVAGLFDELRTVGKEYSSLLFEGKSQEALKLVEELRSRVIQPLLLPTELPSHGRINMTTSQISTTSGPDDIFVLSAGDLNVGKSTFFSDEQQRKGTGIYTAAGGAINIFSYEAINVNESRVMSFRGGDITLWSDRGDINAGRGSKTAVSATPPRLTFVGDALVLVFNPPAVGSGVRAVTFDPDGVEGPLVEPPAGDIYLFAPEGIIDAGEAGIAGTNVFLGATQVLNVENITFTAGSVGVPAAGDAAASIGALSGAATATEGVKDVQQSASMASGRSGGGMDQSATEGFMAKWLEVKVLSFDVEEPAASEEES